MEPSAQSYASTAYVESAEGSDGSSGVREGIGLGPLLVILSPFGLVAWVAIGLGVYRVVT
jgi:hypothetical protein